MAERINQSELPLNWESPQMVHAEDIFMECICTSKLGYGPLVAEMNLQNENMNSWKELSYGSLSMKVEGENVKVYGQKYSEHRIHYLYRDLAEVDEILMTIQYQQYTNAWGRISLFLAEKKCIEDDKKIELGEGELKESQVELGNICKIGPALWLGGQSIDIYCDYCSVTYPYTLGLKYNGKSVQLFTIDENKKTRVIGEDLLEHYFSQQSEIVVGIQLNMGISSWFPWKYTNFIQLYASPDDLVPHYFYKIARTEEENLLHIFLEYQMETVDCIRELLGGAISFFINCIEEKHYIRINTIEDGPVLLYGYQKKQEKFLAILVNSEGETIPKMIAFQTVKEWMEKADKKDCVQLIQYCQAGRIAELETDLILMFLKEFLNSSDSSNRLAFMLPMSRKYIYGMDLIRSFTNEQGIKEMLKDIRILKMLKSHASIMIERLKYLVLYKKITEVNTHPIEEKFETILTRIEESMVCAKNQDKEQLLKCMKDICSKYEASIRDLITALEKGKCCD